MPTVVKLTADAYPFGCKGDVRLLDDEELATLKKLQKSRDHTLYEVQDEQASETGNQSAGQAANEVEELTAENLEKYVKSHKRAELDEEASAAGVEEPEKLQNATEVAKAILAKRAESDDEE